MKSRLFAVLMCLCFIGGCSEGRYTEISPGQPFIASVNILQPSLSFFTQEGEELATWEFDVAYTGAALIQHDYVLLYGHDLTKAHLYELSTGMRVATIECGAGTTNAYYDGRTERFFMTNSKTNTVTSYDLQGGKINERKLYNYPMSMAASGGYLYVVNYKDTVLSVLDIDTFHVVEEWEIAKSSHGLAILEEEHTLWIGGHGVGNKPNATIDVHDLDTGERLKEISMPLMPVGITENGQEVAVISHGKSTLYVASTDGEVLWQQKVGANPFAAVHLRESVAVAGYDDQTIYFVNERGVEKKVQTKQGPFQLFAREGMK
ncbi:MAG: YncE family protein [Lysinibacillus sp.]